MNMHSSAPPTSGSLLERAAAAYGFDDVATAQQMGAAAMLRADHGGEIAVEALRENGYLLPDAPVTGKGCCHLVQWWGSGTQRWWPWLE